MTQPFWRIGGIVLALVLAGCATPDTVMMRNPTTNELARCPAGYQGFIAGEGYRTQEDCVADYQKKGYEPAGSAAGR